MAGLQERGGSYRVIFRFHGKQHFPLGKVSQQEAEAKSAQVEYLLLRLKQRLIELPPGIESPTSSSTTASRPNRPPPRRAVTPALVTLRDRFLAMHAGRTRKTRSTPPASTSTTWSPPSAKIPLPELPRPTCSGTSIAGPGRGHRPGHHQEGDQRLPGGLELGRRTGLVSREWPGQGAGLPEDQGKAAVPDAGGDRAARSPGRPDRRQKAELGNRSI